MNHFKNFISLFALSCAPAFYIWSQNSIAKNHGKQSFKLMDGLNQNLDPLYQSSLKNRAKYPTLSEEYLSSKPEGIILGKHQGKFIRKKLNEDGQTVAAVDLEVPGSGELMGGSQGEDDYDKLIQRMQELGIPQENLDWYTNLRKFGGCYHSGFGLGFERLIMYLTGVDNIRDVIPYPRTPNNCDY